MASYAIVKEEHCTDELGYYISYGIAVSKPDRETYTIHDVFLSESDARKYVKLFNDEQLAPVHLDQVIEEYLQYGDRY